MHTHTHIHIHTSFGSIVFFSLLHNRWSSRVDIVQAMDSNLSADLRPVVETLTRMGNPSLVRRQKYDEDPDYQYTPNEIQATSTPPMVRRKTAETKAKPLKKTQSKRKRRLYSKEEDDTILDFVYQK